MEAQVTVAKDWLSAQTGFSAAYLVIVSMVVAIFVKVLVNAFGRYDIGRVVYFIKCCYM